MEYTGKLDNGVFAYLDAQKPQEEAHHALPELTAPKTGIAKACLAHIKRINDFDGPIEERRKIELDGLRELHAHYPNAGFGKVANQRAKSRG